MQWWLVSLLFTITLAECEYTIVGAGWSGLYYAWRLTQPPLSVPPSSLCIFEAHPTRIGGRAYAYQPEELSSIDDRTILDMGAYHFHYSNHQLVRSIVSDLLNLTTACYHPGTCANSSDEFQRIIIPDGTGRGNSAGYVRGVEGLRDILIRGGMSPITMNHRLVSVFDAGLPLPPTPSCTNPSFSPALRSSSSNSSSSSKSANALVTLRFRVKQALGECTWVHINASSVLLNIPSTSFHTLTQDSIVFTHARPEVLQAYEKPLHTPLARLFLVYEQNAWWKKYFSHLANTTFVLQPSESDEISLSGRFYDGPMFDTCLNSSSSSSSSLLTTSSSLSRSFSGSLSAETDCGGGLLIYMQAPETAKDSAFYQSLKVLQTLSGDPVTRLLPSNPLAKTLFDQIHNSLLDYFESFFLQAGLDPSLLPSPSSLVFSLWWATDYESALYPSWESSLVDCDTAKLFLKPLTMYDVFLANEAWSCAEPGYADSALRGVEKLLVWRYNYTKPETVSESYWETQVLGGSSRLSASLLPRTPECFASTDCFDGAMCLDYFCSPSCTNATFLTDCKNLYDNGTCRSVVCGEKGYCEINFFSTNTSCGSDTSCMTELCNYGYCEVKAPKCEIPAHPECFTSACNDGICTVDIKTNATCADSTHPCGGRCDSRGQCIQMGGKAIGQPCVLGNECCSQFCLREVCSNIPPSDCSLNNNHGDINNFYLGWRFHDVDLVTFVFATNSSGWVALGLGESMTNADMIVAWIDPISGVGSVGDYWSTSTRTPRTDIAQGGTYDLLNAKVESLPSGFLTVSVTRKLNTGDARDIVVSGSQNHFIYAYKNGKSGDFLVHDVYNSLIVNMNCRISPFASHIRTDRKTSQVIAGFPASSRLTTFDKDFNRLRYGGYAQMFSAQTTAGKQPIPVGVVDEENGRYVVSVKIEHVTESMYNYSILFDGSVVEGGEMSVEVLPGPFATAVVTGLSVPVIGELYPFWLIATDGFLNPCNESEALSNRVYIDVVSYVLENKGVREEIPTNCSLTLSQYDKDLSGFACTFNSPHGTEVQHYIEVRVHGAITDASPYLVPHTPHVWATWVIWLLVISIALILVLSLYIFRIWRREKIEKKEERRKEKQTSSVSQRGAYGALGEA